MLQLLKENQGVITLVFAFAVTVSTIVYAYLTWKLVNETKRMRKAQTDPEISISLIQNDKTSIDFIDLVIENIGLGPAYNIKFTVLSEFKLKNLLLSEVGFIKSGIAYFAPKRPMNLWVGSFIHDEKLENKSIELNVTYSNSRGEQFNDKFTLNFSQFSFFTQLGTPPLIKISEHLKSIESNMKDIAIGFKNLNYFSKDIGKEKRETLKD
jgi:hypothetical protein